jgi:hypothetical protein
VPVSRVLPDSVAILEYRLQRGLPDLPGWQPFFFLSALVFMDGTTRRTLARNVLHHLRAFLFLQSDFTPGGRIRLVNFTNYTNEVRNSLLRKSYTTQHNSIGLSFTSTSAHANSWADLSKCYDHEIAATRNAARAASELNFLAREVYKPDVSHRQLPR